MVLSLEQMTWPQVAAAVEAGVTTAILPLGATEQHGPHLPLATDTIRAAALAARLAERLPGALVAPALPVGCSDEHAGFAGLLSLDAATLAAVVVDCARRMAGWGVRRLVVLSAHGGNGRALALAAERLRRELPGLDVWLPGELTAPGDATLAVAADDAVPPEAVGIHAGEGETSELLCLRPELVHMADAAAGYCGDMAAIIPALERHGLRPVTPNGVLGDPAAADAARGARYLDACAAALAMELAAR
jgi:mycofactocin system creatininase family protein